jgi:hypothetical protein
MTSAANRRRAQDARLTLSHLTIELEHQTQNAVGRRVLRSKVQGVVFNFCHVDKHQRLSAQCRPPYFSSRMIRGVISRGSIDTGS